MATQKLLSSLSEADFVLVRETAPEELGGLDEDALLDLHARVRRARNKHVGVYRRDAAVRVSAKGARGQARPANARNAARAEIFEESLARVSRQVAAAARQSAKELKEERLAQARQEAAPAASAAKPPRTSGVKPRVLTDKTRQSPGRKKREAGSIAAGARRQAKRDSR
ncbi:hypothetical protein [Mycolicibacterium confluentis]|uniref:Uncharacterized protein n=1 Tax=Mycolicibacterium confluentis TaxID=28047 RepID=A0A7I7XUT1_9MYCO|nr:hypothetical protein [Mycolicibacterium confluentis]MCV7322266.1 hypothetical protein [Mycolicibacterium confluentis]ORV28411.1 hypothetical protein AWB99_17915 [Mycolicibacterium confluentis]BBZ33050.1 hypothetical protein MCNF_16550 [Mycolicibacterium confluentis]